MMTFALAVRNLKRNRRRSITTLAAIVVGTVAILLFGGYTRNIHYGLQMGFVRSGGHLQIQHQNYFLYGSGNPAAYGIAHYPACHGARASRSGARAAAHGRHPHPLAGWHRRELRGGPVPHGDRHRPGRSGPERTWQME